MGGKLADRECGRPKEGQTKHFRLRPMSAIQRGGKEDWRGKSGFLQSYRCRGRWSLSEDRISLYCPLQSFITLTFCSLTIPTMSSLQLKERATGSSGQHLTKKFNFDRVFSPAADQIEVYQEVVAPVVKEALLGKSLCSVIFLIHSHPLSKTRSNYLLVSPVFVRSLFPYLLVSLQDTIARFSPMVKLEPEKLSPWRASGPRPPTLGTLILYRASFPDASIRYSTRSRPQVYTHFFELRCCANDPYQRTMEIVCSKASML